MRGPLVLQVESRLGAMEGTVFVPERWTDDELEQDAGEVAVTCPSCHARFRLQIAAALA